MQESVAQGILPDRELSRTQASTPLQMTSPKIRRQRRKERCWAEVPAAREAASAVG